LENKIIVRFFVDSKAGISKSLQKLLNRGAKDDEKESVDWLSYFSSPEIRKNTLLLSRGGEENYSSLPLNAVDGENGLELIVDSLIPKPNEEFWNERVVFDGKISSFNAGIEEIVTFSAIVGERIEYEGRPAFVLNELMDLRNESREYLAELGEIFSIELGFIWYGEWFQLEPNRLSVSRLFFDAKLEGNIGVDGYAVPKATLRLEKDGTEIPLKLRIFRNRGGGFEAKIEKIDSLAQQSLNKIIEEIWRIASGLSQRRNQSEDHEVGYVSSKHDALATAFVPHIVLLADNEEWEKTLAKMGEVTAILNDDLNMISDTVSEGRCDLIVGDADFWGSKCIQVERLLRSVSQFRKIPRIWFSDEVEDSSFFIKKPMLEDPSDEKEVEDENLDLIDFGAFDLLPSNPHKVDSRRRLLWAIKSLKTGNGPTVLMLSHEERIRYRLGLALSHMKKIRLIFSESSQGISKLLDQEQPKWILLDAHSFEVELDTILSLTTDWAAKMNAKVLVLARGAGKEKVSKWLMNGAKDIILLDPSLRLAASRLYKRIHGVDPQ